MSTIFEQRKQALTQRYEALIGRTNEKLPDGNGIYDRYKYPLLTAEHAPDLALRLQ